MNALGGTPTRTAGTTPLDTGTSAGGRKTGGGTLKKGGPEYKVNPFMHPSLATLMKPILDAKIQYRVKNIAELAGHKIADLPKWNSVCYQLILGWCVPVKLDALKCNFNNRMNHPNAADIPDNFCHQFGHNASTGSQ